MLQLLVNMEPPTICFTLAFPYFPSATKLHIVTSIIDYAGGSHSYAFREKEKYIGNL